MMVDGKVDIWTARGYPPVQYITYAQDDPDNAMVLNVSSTLKRTRWWMQGQSGFVYRVERLPEAQWKNPNMPEYGNEQYVRYLP